MVDVDKAVIARLKKEGKNFGIVKKTKGIIQKDYPREIRKIG